MQNVTQNPFKKWQIYLAIFFALGVTTYLLIRNFSRTEFVKVKATEGDYVWVDGNHNKSVDLHLSQDFKVSKNGNYTKQTAVEVLQKVDWNAHVFIWMFLAIFGMFGRDLAYMWRIRLLAKGKLSFKRSFFVIMLWEFASALAPGVMSGAAVAMFILHREKIEMGRATAMVILTAFFDNLFYVVFIPLLFLILPATDLFPKDGDISHLSFVFWTGFSVFAVLCLVLFTSIFVYPKLFLKIGNGLKHLPFLNRFHSKALRFGEDLELTARSFKKERFGFWMKVFGATIISWSSRFFVINCILQAFISLGFLQHVQVFMKQFVLWMFLRISPTPGGSGVAEWAFAELLSDYSSSLILLGTLAVFWRLISYYPYLIIGSVILPRWLAKKK
jgi:uncharacterized protein (TIRG00374 family)